LIVFFEALFLNLIRETTLLFFGLTFFNLIVILKKRFGILPSVQHSTRAASVKGGLALANHGGCNAKRPGSWPNFWLGTGFIFD
jgi:hypothetical protein